MPNKPTLPRNARRIPKGYTRKDFEPEVIADLDRTQWRTRKERHRKRRRHAGFRDVTFQASADERAKLAELARQARTTKAAVLRRLITEAPLCPTRTPPPAETP